MTEAIEAIGFTPCLVTEVIEATGSTPFAGLSVAVPEGVFVSVSESSAALRLSPWSARLE